MKPLSPRAWILGALVPLAAAVAPAQENLEMGKMWTFENPPLEYLDTEYGFQPTQEWLDQLRMASLRLDSGCSASFVSPKGLIMTNHHCVRDLIAQVQGDNDWVRDGFIAASHDQEVRLPDVKAQQLVKMVDVTEQMNAGIADDDDANAKMEQRETNEEAILAKAQEDHPGLEGEVVSLFQGAIYQLYLYKNYDDVRLVVAPNLQTAHFGGDPDNFTYPRYSIDFSFCRAWEDGAPVDSSANYFRWSEAGPVKGELTFVTGNPGETNRLKTKAQLEYMRDVEYPINLAMIKVQLDVLRRVAEAIPQAKKQLEAPILGLENSEKAFTGYLGGLQDEKLMAQKEAAEAAFRKRIQEQPETAQLYSSVWDDFARIAEAKRGVFVRSNFYQELLPAGPLARAMLIVQAIDPDASGEERGAAADMARNFAQPRMNVLHSGFLTGHLDLARQWLGDSDPFVQALMGDKNGAQTVAALAESDMKDRDYVEDLLEGGRDLINQSSDLAVQAALVLYPLKAEAEAALEQLEQEEESLGALIGRALHAAYGTGVSPDATFSLRFSDGRVEGYPFNGTIAPWRTSFYGLYARNSEFGNVYPFDLPQVWLDRADKVDMTRSVNFVSANDIIGGNSGSPIVNQKLEVIGLIFDGNIEMLANNFLYRGDIPRSVSVHTDAIMESLTVIYDAKHIADELLSAGR